MIKPLTLNINAMLVFKRAVNLLVTNELDNWVAKNTKGRKIIQKKKNKQQHSDALCHIQNRITTHISCIRKWKEKRVTFPTCAKVSAFQYYCYDIINIKIVAWKICAQERTLNAKQKNEMKEKSVCMKLVFDSEWIFQAPKKKETKSLITTQ